MNDGGPAYPAKRYENVETALTGQSQWLEVDHSGMSLRDWFAGQALAGMMASSADVRQGATAEEQQLTIGQLVTKRCYQYADAMIAQRTKEPL